MQKRTAFSAIVVCTFLAASCNDTNTPLDPNAPTTVHVVQTAVQVSPSILVAETVAHPFCPSVPPFTTTLNLQVRGDSSVNLFVNTIRLNFVDTFGVRMPEVTLPAPVLTTQFGSMLIQARDARAFAIPFRFGCGTHRAGQLTVFVDLRDDRGTMRSQHVTAAVQ